MDHLNTKFVAYYNGYNLCYLCRGKTEELGIESWDWNMEGDKSMYHALYPRSWTVYNGIKMI